MHAFHSNWTEPYIKKHPHTPYEVEDFELLTTILSALKWQEKNGDIEMLTDRRGAMYYRRLGLEGLWNKGISECLENMDSAISEDTFWAAGKLFALSMQKKPCVMMDTDFIVWETLSEKLLEGDVAVIHEEEIDPLVYPAKEELFVSRAYQYPKEWDWQVRPCNTAFAIFNDVGFKDEYVKESFRFMKGVKAFDPLVYMVFAEQRLLAMCAKAKGKHLHVLSNTEELFHGHQTLFTHVWGYKRQLRANSEERAAFCKRCLNRIKVDFPDYFPVVAKIEALKKYQ